MAAATRRQDWSRRGHTDPKGRSLRLLDSELLGRLSEPNAKAAKRAALPLSSDTIPMAWPGSSGATADVMRAPSLNGWQLLLLVGNCTLNSAALFSLSSSAMLSKRRRQGCK